jgi:hypothetical protein
VGYSFIEWLNKIVQFFLNRSVHALLFSETEVTECSNAEASHFLPDVTAYDKDTYNVKTLTNMLTQGN